MARHLAAAGHDVTVYNRSADKAAAWVKANGGHAADCPADAAEGAQAVFTCVGTDDDLAEVTLGSKGAFRTMAQGIAVRRSHHRLREDRAPARRRGQGSRTAGAGRAGVGRAGGRREGRALDHVRRPEGGVRGGKPADAGLCRADGAYRRIGRRADRQDGQPDRDCRRAAGAERGAALRPGRRTRSRQGVRGDLGGRGVELADGQPLGDDGEGRVRLRLRGRLDAQGSRPRARRGRAATAR